MAGQNPIADIFGRIEGEVRQVAAGLDSTEATSEANSMTAMVISQITLDRDDLMRERLRLSIANKKMDDVIFEHFTKLVSEKFAILRDNFGSVNMAGIPDFIANEEGAEDIFNDIEEATYARYIAFAKMQFSIFVGDNEYVEKCAQEVAEAIHNLESAKVAFGEFAGKIVENKKRILVPASAADDGPKIINPGAFIPTKA